MHTKPIPNAWRCWTIIFLKADQISAQNMYVATPVFAACISPRVQLNLKRISWPCKSIVCHRRIMFIHWKRIILTTRREVSTRIARMCEQNFGLMPAGAVRNVFFFSFSYSSWWHNDISIGHHPWGYIAKEATGRQLYTIQTINVCTLHSTPRAHKLTHTEYIQRIRLHLYYFLSCVMFISHRNRIHTYGKSFMINHNSCWRRMPPLFLSFYPNLSSRCWMGFCFVAMRNLPL